MARLATSATLCFLFFAGCFGGSESGPAVSTSGPTPTGSVPDEPAILAARTLVHGPNGVALADDAFPGELPVIEQKYIGTDGAGEPTIAVTPSGAAFYVAMNPGFHPAVWRSKDLGASWTKVTPTLAGPVEYPPITSDPFVYADPITGRVFDVDLNFPSGDCSAVQWTDNEGAAWSRSTTAPCGLERSSHDHQSLATGVPRGEPTSGYENVVHYCVNRGEAWCFRSLDGGATWKPAVATGLRFCGGLTGHVVTGPNGTAYLPQVSCTSTAANQVWVAVSQDGGRKWSKRLVSQGYETGRNFTNAHEGSVAVDAAGNVYHMFMDKQTMPTLVISRDGGDTWSAPMNVARPGLTGATLPSMIAGDEGRIALLYVGTTAPGGHVGPTASTTWNAYVSVSLNALEASPVFATTSANPVNDPVKRGSCSGRCQPTAGGYTAGGMFDFLDISINPTDGRIWAALVDACVDRCVPPGATGDEPQLARAAAGVQTGGATLMAL